MFLVIRKIIIFFKLMDILIVGVGDSIITKKIIAVNLFSVLSSSFFAKNRHIYDIHFHQESKCTFTKCNMVCDIFVDSLETMVMGKIHAS